MPGAVSSMKYDVCSVWCSVCSLQCVVCSLQFAVCIVQCAVCSVQCAVFSVQLAVCSDGNILEQGSPPLGSHNYWPWENNGSVQCGCVVIVCREVVYTTVFLYS